MWCTPILRGQGAGKKVSPVNFEATGSLQLKDEEPRWPFTVLKRRVFVPFRGKAVSLPLSLNTERAYKWT